MKLNSEHFIVGIFLAAFAILLVGLAYKGVRDTEASMKAYAAQQEEARLAKDKQVRDKLKDSTADEINYEIWGKFHD